MNLVENSPRTEIGYFRDAPENTETLERGLASEFRSGHVLDGRFVIRDLISRSGMALIYKAEDAGNENELVAVKAPLPKCEADPNLFLRFQREEIIGRTLDHPFLLRFIPVERKSRPYIVTEYLRGCTLARLLKAGRPSERESLQIISLLCEALRHMHERGVVHRDLKPDNIMVCRDGTIRVIDFGIASAAAARRITLSGLAHAMGTPDYMAPEQVRSRRGDARTDIYAAGVILYEMLTGSVPFQNENPWSALNARVTGDPVAPRKLNPELSEQAEEIVLHAMQREPDERYPSAAAMKAELDAPENVRVTGYCLRLKTPRWRMSMRETPGLVGVLLGVGFILFQIALFLLLRHVLAR